MRARAESDVLTQDAGWSSRRPAQHGRWLRVLLLPVVGMGLGAAPAPLHAQRAALVEVRNFAYDANFRNDEAGLRSAIDVLRSIRLSGSDAPYREYYLSWAYWALAAAQLQRGDVAGATASGRTSASHARAGLHDRPDDPEFHTALVNALIVVGTLTPEERAATMTEAVGSRSRALEAGPGNPRVLLMDAGVLFNAPADRGGGHASGIARWYEALQAFEAEAGHATDVLHPRWGYVLAQGWLAGVLVSTAPPRLKEAEELAETALRARPDFWFLKNVVMPRIHAGGQ